MQSAYRDNGDVRARLDGDIRALFAARERVGGSSLEVKASGAPEPDTLEGVSEQERIRLLGLRLCGERVDRFEVGCVGRREEEVDGFGELCCLCQW